MEQFCGDSQLSAHRNRTCGSTDPASSAQSGNAGGWQKQITLRSNWDGNKKPNKQKALHLYPGTSQYFSAKMTRYRGVYSCYYSKQKAFSVKMSDTS